MPNTVISPNMNIVVPVNGVDPSPDWGANLQTALETTIDAHDHSNGKGVPITPSGININADLSCAGTAASTPRNVTGLRTVRFAPQSTQPVLGSDIGCIYEYLGELWYNDASSRQVKLTNLGNVNSSPQNLSTADVFGSYTLLSSGIEQLVFIHSAGGSGILTLPASSSVAPGRVYYVADTGLSSAINPTTFVPNGSDTINGVNAPFVVACNGGLTILTNANTSIAGTGWTVNTIPTQPLGTNSATIATLTTGTVTPTAAQLSTGVLRFIGTLTGPVTIVFPNGQGYYLCDFSAVVMGGNTIAVKSGTATSATMAAANIGSTATLAQLTSVLTYGGNTIRVKA